MSFIPPLASLADLAKELQKSGKGNVEGGFEDAIRRERTKIYVEQVRSLEQFQEKFATLIQSYISPNRLVVFVDDLDRCLPEKSIQVLEAIKLFLDVRNCVFVLGVDQDVIARGIEMKYKEFKEKQDTDRQPRFTIEGVKYLEKIIQLPFQIPPIESADMSNFVYGLSAEWPHEECPKIFAEGLGDNPRQIKRTVNVFLMLWNLANKRKVKLEGRIKPIRLAKVVAIQAIFPELYNLIKDEPRYLSELEDYFRTLAFGGVVNTEDGQETVEIQKEPPPALASFVSKQSVERVLTMHLLDFPDANFVGLKSDELKLYFTLTRRAETPQPTPPPEAAPLVFELQTIKIPAGEFLMGSTKEQSAQVIKDGADEDWAGWEQPQHTVELSEYSIGKYPVTNREYQAFIRDARYKPPRGWDSEQFPVEKGSHPVVNISWNDAVAYCKWLSEKSGKLYRLPTEAEWEKAARGEDGRLYPWGDQLNLNCANTFEAKLETMSEVGQFSPQGDSPYSCVDMAGNVWEWCNDWFDENQYKRNRVDRIVKDPQGIQVGEARVLRGGSFYFNLWHARCAVRYWNYPNHVLRYMVGFRVCISPLRQRLISSEK